MNNTFRPFIAAVFTLALVSTGCAAQSNQNEPVVLPEFDLDRDPPPVLQYDFANGDAYIHQHHYGFGTMDTSRAEPKSQFRARTPRRPRPLPRRRPLRNRSAAR
jgi:hypothetical protein